MSDFNQIGYLNNTKKLSNLPSYATINHDVSGQYAKRYYSSNEAEIYISGINGEALPNDGYVDEIVQIQFSVQQNTLPLFGYNSYVYDEIAIGSRIVQGTFVINFTSPNYLFNLLDSMPSINDNKNRMPLWGEVFSIDVVYGGTSTESDTITIEPFRSTLEGVTIIGCSQQLDTEGNPIFEQYSFIARDYIPNASAINTSNAQQLTEKDQNNTNSNSNISLSDVIQLISYDSSKQMIFVDTSQAYEDVVINYMEVILSGSGITPTNISKEMIYQKDKRWGASLRNQEHEIDPNYACMAKINIDYEYDNKAFRKQLNRAITYI